MSLGAVIYARLHDNAAIVALVGTRIHPLKAPQGAALPRIVYKVVSGESLGSFDGPNGQAVYRVQLDLVAATYDGIDALATAVRKRVADGGPLDGYRGTTASVVVQACYRIDETDVDEPPDPADETGLFVKSMDFEIWIEEA